MVFKCCIFSLLFITGHCLSVVVVVFCLFVCFFIAIAYSWVRYTSSNLSIHLSKNCGVVYFYVALIAVSMKLCILAVLDIHFNQAY